MIAKIKEDLENRLFAIAKKVKISPNILTLFSILFMAVAGYEIVLGNLFFGAIFLALSGIFDLLDGTVAKARKKETKFGMFFDRISDRICDFIIISSIFIGGYINIFLALLTIFFMYTASYESAVLESLTKSKIGEQLSQRALRLTILFFALIFSQIYYGVLIVLFISIFSFFKRLHYAKTHL